LRGPHSRGTSIEGVREDAAVVGGVPMSDSSTNRPKGTIEAFDAETLEVRLRESARALRLHAG
jgi:hypothetical protein